MQRGEGSAVRSTLAELFLQLAKPDEEGFSRAVGVEEFQGPYERLRLGNGGSWCRDDGPLGRAYNIRRNKDGKRIVSVQLQGLKKQPHARPIPKDISKEIKTKRCAILDVGSQIEADHRDGRRDDPRLREGETVTIDDFQPLSKASNNAKRQHCKTCRDTGRRYDAQRLGYSVSQIKGNGKYNGTCIGCYWHDPYRFNQEISQHFTQFDES